MSRVGEAQGELRQALKDLAGAQTWEETHAAVVAINAAHDRIARARELMGHQGAEAKRTGNTRRERLENEVMDLRRVLESAMKLLGEAAELGQGEDWADDLAERVEDLEADVAAIERAG